MPEPAAPTIAILHPGEMGVAVGRALREGGLRVVGCAEGRSQASRERACEAGFELLPELAAALRDASLVISLVAPEGAVETALRTAAALADHPGPAPLYLDANSIAPPVVQQIAASLARAGVVCVDGAVIGQARALRSGGELILAGSEAERVRELLAGAFPVRVVGKGLGAASGFKLAVSAWSKGLVALYFETLSAAAAVGLEEEMFRHLGERYAGSVSTLERLVPTYPRHVARRVGEMAQLASWLDAAGHSAAMADAARQTFARLARAELPGEVGTGLREVSEAFLRSGALGPAGGPPAGEPPEGGPGPPR